MGAAREDEALGRASRPPRAQAVRRTAFHEAGHAVMAHKFGRIVDWISIEGDREFRGQIRIRHRPKPLFARGRVGWLEVEAEIMVALAGAAAEVVLVGSRRGVTGEDLDLSFAKCTADQVCHSAEEAEALRGWLFVRAKETLRKPPVWRAVGALAQRLILNGEMGRFGVLTTIERALAAGGT